MNQEIIEEIKNQDYAVITEKIENFLINEIEKNNAKGLILGLSGGIDSAVLAYICKRKLKEKTIAIIMPDTSITPSVETEDAMKMISLTGIEYKLIDIKPIVTEYGMYLEPNEKAKGNLRARVRTNILYYYANAKNYLVLGSSDKSEYNIGYFTKYGDGASDIIKQNRESFDDVLDDDLNTHLALSAFFQLAKETNRMAADGKLNKSNAKNIMKEFQRMSQVLGLHIPEITSTQKDEIDSLILKREELRKEKQFEEADKIRDKINEMNIELIDHKGKTIWIKKEKINLE